MAINQSRAHLQQFDQGAAEGGCFHAAHCGGGDALDIVFNLRGGGRRDVWIGWLLSAWRGETEGIIAQAESN